MSQLTRPYIYAQELDGIWSIVETDDRQDRIIRDNLTRDEAIEYLKDNRQQATDHLRPAEARP